MTKLTILAEIHLLRNSFFFIVESQYTRYYIYSFDPASFINADVWKIAQKSLITFGRYSYV